MKLRGRVALVSLAIVVPAVVLTSVLASRLRERAMLESAAALVLHRMEAGGREACEASPGTWAQHRGRRRFRGPPPGPGPGLRLFVYDTDFRPASRRAPRLGPALERRLAAGETAAIQVVRRADHALRRVAVAMPWSEGACAIVLVEQPAPPGLGRPFWQTAALPLVVAVGVVLLVVLALGPTVSRLRRLTAAVRRSAGAGYAAPTDLPRGGDEVGELAGAFAEAADEVRRRMEELRARDESLTQFLANTTHDVMIPLTVLQGHLASFEAATAEGRPPDAGRVREAMEEAHYLGALLQNLRLAARFETGAPRLERHPVDLGGLVDRVAGRYAPVARQRGVSLDHAAPEAPLLASADVTMLEQAVGNLVHNAIRYNGSGGHVALVLERRGARGFVLRVLDDGPGLTEAELARVTERGFRGDAARTRAPTGLGLGLHIAGTVVAAHGFTLELRGREGGGLEVCLAGPAQAPLEEPGNRRTGKA